MSQYTVDKVLSSETCMDDFIHSLSHHGILNMSGSAYRTVRLCHWSGGILLTSNHHRDCSCSIRIVSDRSATCSKGCDDPRCNGDPFPKLSKGEFIVVWADGEWVKKGPWEKPIKELLENLILELNTAERKLTEQQQLKAIEEMREKTDKANRLIEEWSDE
jgi:hypothetical protein